MNTEGQPKAVGMECFMRTLALQLFNQKSRPSFQYTSNDIKVMCLIDSGAETPVWCSGEELFLSAYPKAIKQNYDSEIRGFGKGADKGKVYVIPDFFIADGKETYRIKNLQVAVCYHPLIGYDFVMSDTMFAKTDTFIHRMGGKYIEFFYEKEIYHCAVKRAGNAFSIVTFAQEEG
ncbi:MAG: hypothetical protein IJU50_11560 [Lachnospiraceae bacterium]|nr:hypothetical protein [Lachnospiraceae bacterium]